MRASWRVIGRLAFASLAVGKPMQTPRYLKRSHTHAINLWGPQIRMKKRILVLGRE
jgi:hypothetical protein